MDNANIYSPGQWLPFAMDWQQAAPEFPSALNVHTEAMEALLVAQQETTSQLRAVRHFKPCRQFSATFKIPNWERINESLQTAPSSNGIDYFYTYCGRICFKGTLTSIWEPDGQGLHGLPRVPLSPSLMHYKLHQFREQLPLISHFWIFVNTLVSSHFLFHHYAEMPRGVLHTLPQMLGHKVQFDQIALESIYSLIGAAPLSYAVNRLNVGKYEAFTLGTFSGDRLLMRTELGILKPIVETGEIDIPLD